MTAQPTVVLVGDSITDAGWRDDLLRLGWGYVRDLASGPLAGCDVVNAGTGGDRVRDLAERWEHDVLVPMPSLVSVYVGINDTWRRYDQGDETSLDAFVDTYATLLATLGQRRIPAVLVEPWVLPVTPDQEEWAEDLAPKQDAVRRLAAERGAAFVALAEPLRTLAASLGGNELVAPDGVHPTPTGHREIARLWWEAAGDAVASLTP
ncbi:SGNH/GDSL hydrolase family protein [Luteimicrobium subarcticum]|uniref:Lysophospholipase L1-like esterase n=1 Tax=Luteimicrobium subarcticum TaxID=620910 RepID=A0A2M8WRL1_9MICO|nr:SGNH/GDSL hydrolase family protein [Luteimicrobium subarcticum]PJI93575.1 lysophospholipase L1-like esterase [Luteimicrobium subarcticum]